MQMRGRFGTGIALPSVMRSSAAALVVGVLVGCGHGSASLPLRSRVAATMKPATAPPPVCRLPGGEEPNCSCDDGDCAAKLGVLYADDHRDGEARRLFERACARGSAIGCNNLATFVLAGLSGPPDAAAAARLFETACRHLDRSACYNLGVLYEDGEGVARDAFVGAQLLQQSCGMGMAHACTALGILFANGLTGIVDNQRALESFARACDRGDGEGCTLLAERYARDLDQARRLLQRGCEAGDLHACQQIR